MNEKERELDKEIIISFYIDYKASRASNISELEEMCRMQVMLGDIPSSIYYEVSQLISDFKWSEHTSDTFFIDYFHSHHLVVPPSYDEELHRNLGYYPIYKIIYWMRYPNRFTFDEIYDRLLPKSEISYSSNISIVGVNPRDYLNEKGRRLSIWTYPSIKGKSFYITGEIELIDPSTQKPYSLKALSSLIRKNEGIVEKQITPSLDYIIVGGFHSPSYTGKYKGQKWLKTDRSRSIPIISDIDLFMSLTAETTF